MYNYNPTLLHGQVLAWLTRSGVDVPEHEQRWIELRVYPPDGAGFYFVRGMSALKWYRDNDPTDGHFNNCSLEDVEEAIKNNGRVQVVGSRGKSYGVWDTWNDFEKAILL